MNEELMEQLNELVEELAMDGYYVTVLVTGKGSDLELTARPSQNPGQSTIAESVFLH